MNKRGIELSLNLIIILLLALIALIVITIIFSGGANNFAEKIKSIMNEIWAGKPDLNSGQCIKKEGVQGLTVICHAFPTQEKCIQHRECIWA